jgi:hypothetical protein
MDQNQLFKAMFKDDTEGQKLILVPGSEELMTQFEQKFTGIIHSMFEFGLKVRGYILSFLVFVCLFSRKKNYEIMKLKIFGYVFMKQKMKIHVELQLLLMNLKLIE